MPTGTFVFLFSDIEGSTVRWEAQPELMQSAVHRHDDLVRAAMEAHGGLVFKTVGDAFCVAFTSPGEALRAAFEAQRALDAEDWSAVDGLRVRMALHAGEAHERAGDYFGPAVNRVARLLSTAHGAQTLVSGAVADAAGADLPPGLSLRALGTFHLKDLERPERIYQLVAAGLPSHFKPLRTLDAVPNNLPIQSTAFVGREADVPAVRKLLSESTLVTIAGPGGVGKTRIALQCAADVIDRMPDGAWFVNLAPLADPALVGSTILAALGAGSEGANATESLVTYLQSRELLIVLDNCEHVIGQAAHVVTAIREQCPGVTILATSRELLHVDGERVFRLPPLDIADSVRLFAQRAQAASPAFTVTASNAAEVEDICRHLDGIPLAIELAAARLRALSLDDLGKRLTERFRVLTGGTRTALPRQQTLRALIDWSYELLTDDERTLFRRVSAFSGSFSLDAASHVCSDESLDEWTILDLLSSLVDKSLVVTGAEQTRARYSLLETIREYAQGRQLETGEALRLAERHAEYFAKIAGEAYAQFDTRPPADWLDRLLPDLDNFRSALQWSLDADRSSLGAEIAAGAGPVFLRLSLLDEGIAWCTRAAEKPAGVPADLRARIDYVRSMLFNNQGNYDRALPCAEQAVTFYREARDDRGLTRALSQVAQLTARAGRFEKARPFADEAIARARATGDVMLLASVLRRCAFALPPSDIERARSQFQEAAQLLRSAGEDQEACLVLEWWAEAEANADCFDRAFAIAQDALKWADRDTRMYLLSNIVGYALASGNFAGAAPYIGESLTLAVEGRHVFATALGIAYTAATRADTNAPEAARLFGYAAAQIHKLQWNGYRADRLARENILENLRQRLGAQNLASLLSEGEAFSAEEALAKALAG